MLLLARSILTNLATVTTAIGLLTKRVSINPQKVYPTLAACVTVTGSATANTLGSGASIVPLSTITSAFIVDAINVEALTATASAELVLYDDSVEFARVRLGSSNAVVPTPTGVVVAANSAITAKLSTVAGGSQTCKISISYHLA